MDTQMVLRDGSADLTADETLTAFTVGPMMRPFWLHVITEHASEASDTLDTEIEFCTAAAPTVQVANINCPQINAAVANQHMAFPFFCPPGLPVIQVKLNITDADTGSDFNTGATKVWIDTTNRYAGDYDS